MDKFDFEKIRTDAFPEETWIGLETSLETLRICQESYGWDASKEFSEYICSFIFDGGHRCFILLMIPYRYDAFKVPDKESVLKDLNTALNTIVLPSYMQQHGMRASEIPAFHFRNLLVKDGTAGFIVEGYIK